jgi:DNA-binding NarL/FixJ family response regulator
MDALISKLEGNLSSIGEGIHVLLVGANETRILRQTLESEGDPLIISEAKTVDEVLAIVGVELPDVIIVLTDYITPVEIFNNTLMTLSKIGMSNRTIVISDNPIRYLSCALKAKVAALLFRKIDNRNLVTIIHEVRTWSHGQPIPSGINCMDNHPGPETKSGGE